MFTPLVRLAVIIATIAFGIREAGEEPLLAVWLFAAAGLFAWGHFRYGTVWLAFRALSRGDMEKARSLIGMIRRPGLLAPRERAYRAWILGLLELDRGDAAAGAAHLRAALEIGLRTPNDTCAVACSLAEASLDLGDRDTAAGLFEKAKLLPHGEGLEPFLDRLEGRLSGEPGPPPPAADPPGAP